MKQGLSREQARAAKLRQMNRAVSTPDTRFIQLASKYSNKACAWCDGYIGYREQIMWSPGVAYHTACFPARHRELEKR